MALTSRIDALVEKITITTDNTGSGINAQSKVKGKGTVRVARGLFGEPLEEDKDNDDDNDNFVI